MNKKRSIYISKIKKWSRVFLFGSDDIEFIGHQRQSAAEINYVPLVTTTVIASILFIFLHVLSKWYVVYENIHILNFVFMSISLLLFIFEMTYLRKHRKYSTVIYYLYIITCYIYIILLGAIFMPTHISPWVGISMCVFPTLLFTYPFLHYIFNTIVSAIYITLCFVIKDQTMAIRETIITVLALFCSYFATLILTYQRVSSLKANTRYEQDSRTDDLTGLPNRRAINMRLNNAHNKLGEFMAGMIMLDVDNFKAYNDNYGHIKGDEALIKIGNVLRIISTKYNVFIGRYGGEEFIVFVNFISINDIDVIAKEIKDSVNNLNIDFVSNPSKEKQLTVSIGVARTEPGDDALDVLNNADIALYQSKNKGRNIITDKN